MEDQLTGVEWLKKQSWVDGDRLGIHGCCLLLILCLCGVIILFVVDWLMSNKTQFPICWDTTFTDQIQLWM